MFGYVAQFVYEGDSPLAERRAAALTLDQGLLAELLGRAELRELLDPDVLAEVEAELQRTIPDRRARDAEGVADLLRLLGPLTLDEVTARSRDEAPVPDWLADLATARRVVPVRMAYGDAWAAVEDVARLRDGLGVPVPPGTPAVFTEPVDDPLSDLVGRYARTHGPFTADQVATRLGLGIAVVRHTLQRLEAQGRVLVGRVPAGGGRRGVVRRRGAAPAPAPFARQAAPRDRAGGAGDARAVHRWPGTRLRRTARGLRGADGRPAHGRAAGRLPRCRPAGWSPWCSRRGCATTSRPCSTS